MISEKRHQDIVAVVDELGSISLSELAARLQISESTIRRDLTALDREGRLLKVRGGAMSLSGNYHMQDDAVDYRREQNREEKIEIARYAADLVADHDIVYLDAGTTTDLMIDYINVPDVVFVTNSFSHAKRLAARGYETHVIGGELKPVTEAIVGEEAILSLERYNFTKGFWGTNGVTKKNGFSTPDMKEAMVKKKSMQKTKERYVLCDSSKFGEICPISFAEFQSARIITTKIENNEYKGNANIMEVSR